MDNYIDNDDDLFTGKEHTPIRKDAFDLSTEEKIEKIQNCCLNHFDDYEDSLLENVSFEFFAEEDL